ncbi:ABC transporter permease [Streptomyces sp. RB6PN25]|uniref:ABC transporter permease n=1 Tax=Streptomyces humicola TaxID=2953240 RepID=A0ABT1PWE2_9ACTN|nr:ABC transporter permease [Streptomyces humicola]MCQ4080887.1 ABC transporter permease [Streptomyces humicola]
MAPDLLSQEHEVGNAAGASEDRSRGGLWARVSRIERVPIPALAALALIVIVFGLANSTFLTLANMQALADQSAIPVVLAVGMTFVILMGSIDLSVEGVVAATSMVSALLVINDRTHHHLGLWAVLISVAVGAGIGAVAGLSVTRLRIPSFLVTIGTWQIGIGIAQVLFGGQPPVVRDRELLSWALKTWLGMPRLAFVALAVVLLGLWVQHMTRFGRYAYVIGGGEDIARLSGIKVARFRTLAFIVAGACSGLAGVMATSRSGQGAVANGNGYLFLTIAGVVIGGTLLTGGRGGVLHSVVGVLIMVSITNGMILVGISPYVQQSVQGAIVVLAVTATLWRLRERLRVVK